MNRINTWLEKHNLRNFPTLIVVVTFVVFVFMIISFLNHNDEDSSTIYVTEDTELRTGPSPIYPEVNSIYKGQNFHKISKTGKWIQVESSNGKEKGWVAGWHTNLNIEADANPNAKPLKDKTIVLDPGHGGSDQGASSNTKKHSREKVYTLKTAKELKSLLEKEGAVVNMTREADEYVTLEQRNIKGDAYISIHNDSLKSAKANGSTVYWYKDNQEALAETISATLQKKALLTSKGARQENYQVLRQTDVPAVLLELGYISNPTDEDMITDKLHRHILEKAVVDGLRSYFSE
ncbi:N-acetylmuramoyl-L-alanine amidase [Staphylococcus succinus]|uniref:N-acetylmuramoyl-L-alanine amidase n=1 Tax=Staphylococcus succinus TaxID=61015 RepID=UPI00062BE3F1|nr:N-acetylmuramoyl-L-alanine amidase [Staphylococcus succinus]MDH9161774.1 N-acetylmuramoyl-L-alanine amidase [Staphylococcus succinus]PNZ23175.1 cell wall amidase [Staphylococcus succinus subsp. succinus]RIN26233.1 cell wall amidase [Staphylococcus succinus]RIN37706.1 cell wall amidase [Staphylococcus succinus]RIN41702.1 cell wall amidase [Staphylococcus succinus]